MTEEYYYTDNIRIKDGFMEYKYNKIFKRIKYHNWHHILSEYGWEKIHKRWIIQLNRLSKFKSKNSRYGILDCDSDGDCFFHCIANALNEKERDNNIIYNSEDIRNMISENLTEEQYDMIIGYYRIMKDADDFSEDWDPYQVNSLEDFKQKLTTSGHEYWGDYILLQVLMNILGCNIFILNCNSYTNDFSIYNTLNDYNPAYDSIFLIYENDCHFKLVGYFQDKIISYFNDNNIPQELKTLYRLN